jgi:hypothetical protein
MSGGAPVDQSIVFHRAGGATGFAGTWKGDAIKLSPFVLEIKPYQSDGLTFRIPDVFEVNAKFDGKEYPMTGTQSPNGSLASFKRAGSNGFTTTQKAPDRTVILQAAVTVSADGKTLTEAGQSGSVKRTWVFDRDK